MKKFILSFFIIFLICSLISCGEAQTEISVNIDGKKIECDVSPVIVNDRTLVPMRSIFEAIGALVNWDDSQNKAIAERNNTKIEFKIDDNIMYKDGMPITLDVPAKIIDNRTMVPIRAIAESFDLIVNWDEHSKSVNIKTVSGDLLKVHYLDVSQADSIFIELPNGKNMLIDAGEAESSKEIISYIVSKGYKRLNYVVATHPHADHIGGMADIINSFEIDKFYMPSATASTKTFEKMLVALGESNCEKIYAKSGNKIFEGEDISAMFLAPCNTKYEDLNNYSAVIKLTYKNSSFLFMGDAEKISENEILSSGIDIKADVLKIGHHGSNSSTSTEFLQAVNPKYAVISVGENNSYGHPSEQIVSRLNDFKISCFQTKDDGTITFNTDGTTYTIDKTKKD